MTLGRLTASWIVLGLLASLLSCQRSPSAVERKFSVRVPSEVDAAFPALRIFQVIQEGETLFLRGSSGKSTVLLSWSAQSGSEVVVSDQGFPQGLVPGMFDIVDGDVCFLFFRDHEDSSEGGPPRQILRWTGDGWERMGPLGPWLKHATSFVDGDEESFIRLIGRKGEVVRWYEEDAGVVDILEDGGGLRALTEQGGMIRSFMRSGHAWFAVFDKVAAGGVIGEVETPSGKWGEHETSIVPSLWTKCGGGEWTMLYEATEGEELVAAHPVRGELYILLSGIEDSYSVESSGVALHFVSSTALSASHEPLKANAGFVWRSAEPLVWVQEDNQVDIYKVAVK